MYWLPTASTRIKYRTTLKRMLFFPINLQNELPTNRRTTQRNDITVGKAHRSHPNLTHPTRPIKPQIPYRRFVTGKRVSSERKRIK